jgi:hypothetical protein
MSVGDRLRHSWNAFLNKDNALSGGSYNLGSGYFTRPDRNRFYVINERSIITSIYNRLSIDVAAIDIRHVRLDSENRYMEEIDSGLNNCLTVEANIDQAATAFRQDIAMTLFDKGIAAIVPVDLTVDPRLSTSWDIRTMRVGHITCWYPKHVKVLLYNESTGQREEITLEKSMVAIVENPLFSVMNEPNSTLQRLLRKLSLLDEIDEEGGSRKLDLIIQLPYVIKSEARKQQAEQRRQDIEFQLKSSKFGIAYTDGTERITQLNRPAESNLLPQVEYLTKLLYSQLGITEEILKGVADEKIMLNYMNRTVLPVITAITEAMNRTFLTKTARTQRQSIMFFNDPFKLVPVENIAEIADKFTRNEIMTANEIRSVIGFRPAKDPKADQLMNSNMPQPGSEPDAAAEPPMDQAVSPNFDTMEGDSQNGS